MENLVRSVKAFKAPVILIAGGKDNEELDYEQFAPEIIDHARVLVLVGEGVELQHHHDDTAGLGQHGLVWGQVSLLLLLVRLGKHDFLLLDNLHGTLLGSTAPLVQQIVNN